MTPEERYKAQWCRAFLYMPETYSDNQVLDVVRGTEVEKRFEQHFRQRKAVHEFREAVKESIPGWIKRLFA